MERIHTAQLIPFTGSQGTQILKNWGVVGGSRTSGCWLVVRSRKQRGGDGAAAAGGRTRECRKHLWHFLLPASLCLLLSYLFLLFASIIYICVLFSSYLSQVLSHSISFLFYLVLSFLRIIFFLLPSHFTLTPFVS